MSHNYDTEIVQSLRDLVDEASLRYVPPPDRHEAGKILQVDVTTIAPAIEGRVSLKIESFVGGGFAGQVYRTTLLKFEPKTLESSGLKIGGTYAVKIHIPPSAGACKFRNAIYWLGFQASFAPQVDPNAARTGALWQKLIRRGAKVRFGTEQSVADIYATFFDPEMESYGDIIEWIDGRTWQLEIDRDVLNRSAIPPELTGSSKEYLAKKSFMAEFVVLLRDMGADELARQYEWWTCKSQPNVFKRTDETATPGAGLTALDFRTGLALLFFLPMSPADFRLIRDGVRRGVLVQFDRSNFKSLRKFRHEYAEEFEPLESVVEELHRVDPQYREAQPDITHHRSRLLFDGELRQKIKNGLIRGWTRRRLIDAPHGAALEGSAFTFTLFYLLGAIPLLGRFLRCLWGNDAFRAHIKGCCSSLEYLRRTLRAKQAMCLIHWYRKGRIDTNGREFFLKHPLVFSILRIFPGLLPLPARMHRCLIDWKYAFARAKAAVAFPLQFYRSSECRIAWLSNEIDVGESQGMLMPQEKERILSQIKSPFIQKYLKCLAVHFCTFPVTKVAMIILALYAYFYFGNSWHESLAYAVASMIIITILPISPGSFLRGSYVVYLMIRERNVRNYWIAALVSYWHYIGYLGFPLQMAKEFPALTRLMASRWVTGAVKVVPVFGESGALLEHAVFDLVVNVPLSLRQRFRDRKLRSKGLVIDKEANTIQPARREPAKENPGTTDDWL